MWISHVAVGIRLQDSFGLPRTLLSYCLTLPHALLHTSAVPYTASMLHNTALLHTVTHYCMYCPKAVHWCCTLPLALSHTVARCRTLSHTSAGTAIHCHIHCRIHVHTHCYTPPLHCTAAHCCLHCHTLSLTALLHFAALPHCHKLVHYCTMLYALPHTVAPPNTAEHCRIHGSGSKLL